MSFFKKVGKAIGRTGGTLFPGGLLVDPIKKALSGGGGNKINTDNRTESRNQFSDYLNTVIEKQKQQADQPRLTAEDLFGGQMQRLRDTAGAGANATKRMLSRAIMGQGGDISGSGASNLLGVDQQLNEQLGQQGLGFERLALGENRYQTGRGDRLLNTGLQGLQNLYGIDQGLYMDQVMQEQARKQRQSNLFGNIIQTGALAASLFCWVAEELYGEDSNEFHSIRAYLKDEMDHDGPLKEFATAYKEDGPALVEEIRTDPDKRRKTKVLFDHLYELSKAA